MSARVEPALLPAAAEAKEVGAIVSVLEEAGPASECRRGGGEEGVHARGAVAIRAGASGSWIA